MIPWLQQDAPFPPVDQALGHPDGLLCAGADLSPERLLDAYRQGIFPWFGPGEPILWWSPDPRMVLLPDQVHVSRRLQRSLRQAAFSISLDRCFEQVMWHCAQPRPGQPETWITDSMVQAYVRLHRLGHAHSLEVWDEDRLCGGIYGIAIGRAFFGESMFHRVSNASKVALVSLCRFLAHYQFGLLDCQLESGHLHRMGARTIPRVEFARALDSLCDAADIDGDWHSAARPVQLAAVLRDAPEDSWQRAT